METDRDHHIQAFCVYPLALAIRATNVYEERSLGIHNDETTLKTGLVHLRREKGYSKFHLREQLAVSLVSDAFAIQENDSNSSDFCMLG